MAFTCQRGNNKISDQIKKGNNVKRNKNMVMKYFQVQSILQIIKKGF